MEAKGEAALPDAVVALIQQGRKIDAIKSLREQTGVGLKEAKHAVESYERRHPDLVALPTTSGGSGGLLLLAGIALVVAILLLYR